MARPTKQGIDYFPLDVQFDDKVELLIAEIGSDALSVIITVWQLIYQNEGYYIENGPDLYLLIRRRILVDVRVAEQVILRAVDREIFSKAMHTKHNVITSRAIQKRFFVAASRKMVVNVYKNYLLVDVSAYKNISFTTVYDDKNATNVEVEVEVKEEVKELCLFEKIISYLNKKTSRDFKPTTEATRKVIRARMKDGFKEADFYKVVDNQASRWLGDSKMEQYLRPVTLFNGEKFEGYLNNGTTEAKKGNDNFPAGMK